MAVREKTLTRTVCSVKHLPTGSTQPVSAHKKFWSAAVLLPLFRSQPIRKFTQPSTTARRAFRAPEVRHKPKPITGPPTPTPPKPLYFPVFSAFKYFSYHPKILFSRSTKCFSSRNPCGSRG